jgi:hypothetical protein
MAFYVFIIKNVQLKHKLSLPLVFKSYFFTSNLSTNLGTSHSNQPSMGTSHNKLVVHDSAHTKQLVVNVSVLFVFFN